MPPNTKSSRGKGKKIGRNKTKAERYRLYRAIPNKLTKLKRHLAVHPSDTCAQTALQQARKLIPNLEA
jgi:hypothetical protein